MIFGGGLRRGFEILMGSEKHWGGLGDLRGP